MTAAPAKFSDLRLRMISSVILIAVVIGLLSLGHLWLLGAHVLVVFPLMIWEAVSLIRRWWPDRRLGALVEVWRGAGWCSRRPADCLVQPA